MIYTVTKGAVSFSADTSGAELHSLKLGGKEYLWQCGESWRRYAPLLFPFVCSPKDRAYRAEGRDYRMNANHGFARDLEFRFVSQEEDRLVFELTESDATLSQYPYRFSFKAVYTAQEDGVLVSNVVTNTDDRPIYFYVGGHPAFQCPLEEGESFDDYYIEYEREEHIENSRGDVLADKGNILEVSRELFAWDAIMIDSPASGAVSLKSHKSNRSVTVRWRWSDRPNKYITSGSGERRLEGDCIAVWSPDFEAPFVCLEPWTSLPTYADDEYPDIEKKPRAIRLEPGEVFTFSYGIELR